jgi:lycopene cyclase CruA
LSLVYHLPLSVYHFPLIVLMSNNETEFNLAETRRKFPQLVENLAYLPNREAWLKRIWEIEKRWNDFRANPNAFEEVVHFNSAPKNAVIEEDFEIIYAGGTLGLLHAAVMAKKFNRKVLVFDAHTVGKTHRDWNISDEELQEFVRAGLFFKRGNRKSRGEPLQNRIRQILRRQFAH